jgi:hypothetical protein
LRGQALKGSFRNASPLPTTMNRWEPDGFKVSEANGQSLTYVYSREDESSAVTAGVLTEDEARRIASNMGKCQNC